MKKIVLHNSPRPLTMLCRVDQAGHVAIWVFVFVHQLVGVAYFVEPLDKEQISQLLDDRKRVGNPAGPHRVPNAVDF